VSSTPYNVTDDWANTTGDPEMPNTAVAASRRRLDFILSPIFIGLPHCCFF